MDDWYAHWFDEDYERLYAHRDQDEARMAVATALRVAPILASGPVLDLGCGSGRHLAELRKVNPFAFGLDLSSHLLGSAPENLRPWLLQGDMRQLPLRSNSLQGIALWFTPFGYFPDADNRRLLRRLSDLLRSGGVLVMDYLHAAHVARSLEAESRMEQGGLRAVVRREIREDRVVKRILLERVDSGARREVVESVHLYSPETLEQMASEAGLSLLVALGDYQGTEFDPASSERWIAIFEK